MTWKVRHEGSTRSVPVATVEEIHQGLADGLWTPEDEVQAPGEGTWTPLSAHPATEDAAAEVEPPEPAFHPDETHLDMTALIDVCLVLLIFFMLLVAYTAIQKRLQADFAGSNQKGNVQQIPEQQARDTMILLKLTRENDRTVYRANVQQGDKLVPKELNPDQLEAELRALVTPERQTVLLDHADAVPHGDVVKAQDAATGLRLKIRVLMPGPPGR